MVTQLKRRKYIYNMTNGIEYELNFWKEFVQTPRFLEGWCSNIKTPELHESVYKFIIDKLPAKVLDCGSGVCSILTGTIPNKDLTVCDLLGDEYAKFFDYNKHNIVQPLPIDCESIDLFFDGVFDIVHISNALDHTQDAVESFYNLLGATKQGGHLIVQGFENEGLYENWQGLHQWNLSLNDKIFVITDNEGEAFEIYADPIVAERIYLPTMEKYWIVYIIQK